MFSRMPAVWTGATHGYRKGREIVEFKMAVGMNNIASIVTTRLCTIVNLYMIKLSIFTSLITNDTPLPATQRMNHALLTVLLQMSQALQFFLSHSFYRKVWKYKKIFSCQLSNFFILLLWVHIISFYRKFCCEFFKSECCIIFFMFMYIFSYYVTILSTELYC